MSRTILATLVAALALLTAVPATATESDALVTAGQLAEAATPATGRATVAPRALARSPWFGRDLVGDAFRPQGDLRHVLVENGRQQMRFTWRTVARPRWDYASTDRLTGMSFLIDWRNSPLAHNRQLVVFKEDNVFFAAIFNGRGQLVCSRQGGVWGLPNNGFRISAPVVQCLGGARVVRVSGGFLDDVDDSAGVDQRLDIVPNGRYYGPFIALPQPRTGGGARSGDATVRGWTVH